MIWILCICINKRSINGIVLLTIVVITSWLYLMWFSFSLLFYWLFCFVDLLKFFSALISKKCSWDWCKQVALRQKTLIKQNTPMRIYQHERLTTSEWFFELHLSMHRLSYFINWDKKCSIWKGFINGLNFRWIPLKQRIIEQFCFHLPFVTRYYFMKVHFTVPNSGLNNYKRCKIMVKWNHK